MPETFMMYVASDEIVPLQELLELTGNDDIQPHTDGTGIIGYTVQWDDVTVKLMTLPDDIFAINRQNMVQYMSSLVDERQDKRARKAKRRAEGMSMAYEVAVTPGWDDGAKAAQLLTGIMAYYDYAFIFAKDAYYNENGNRIIGREKSDVRIFPRSDDATQYSHEAIARKTRSLKTLQKQGVPYIEHLPPIADASQTTLRSVEAIAERIMALLLISQRANGGTVTTFQEQMQRLGLQDALTPEEKRFAQDMDPEEYMFAMYGARHESAYALLWSLGYVEELGKPVHRADSGLLNDAYHQSVDSLIAQANLRDISTILDEADLIYRYHWALVDAELYDTAKPEGLLVTVVEERHRALNWLIGYQNQDWDEVTTDT
ncbi:MAG: DUF4272 domain-containing protein [Anaerolineae bacterium]|nr:DUF4272 domain-containing protein [Anaerolineae bacterium]MCA9892333.1 DUF4272 domain-containing protein [Anaerolineae bacterium]